MRIKIPHQHVLHLIAATTLALSLYGALVAEEPSKAANSGAEMRVQIHPVSRCQLGDLNLIANEIVRDLPERRRIIATIEPLPGGASFPPVHSEQLLTLEQTTPATFLTQSFSVRVPNLPDATLAGFYLCKDGEDKGTCSEKPIESFDAMMSEHHIPEDQIDEKTGRILGAVPPPSARPDKIYFFTPVILKGGSVLPLSGGKSIDDLKAELRTYLSPQSAAESYILHAVEALGSTFPNKVEGGVSLELPFNDAAKCYELAPRR